MSAYNEVKKTTDDPTKDCPTLHINDDLSQKDHNKNPKFESSVDLLRALKNLKRRSLNKTNWNFK
jgi:hypothetical protein